jgi:serine/threonine protein phosphatase PrpC
MVTCTQCGMQNADEANFCDRCGQGLALASERPAPPALSPLAAGAELKGGWRIVELISQTAYENRYRAERPSTGGKTERVQLRERALEPDAEGGEPVEEKPSPPAAGATEQNPNGPNAKTAELHPPPGLASARAEGEVQAPETAVASADPIAAAGAESLAEDAADAVILTEDEAEASEGEPLPEAAADAPPLDNGAAPAESAVDGAIASTPAINGATPAEASPPPHTTDDLGEVYGRVMALSLTLGYPAFQRAQSGFADGDRAYLIYPDEALTALAAGASRLPMSAGEALAIAIQLCQAVGFAHRRGLRVNDICPESVASDADGRIRLTGLDYVSNDDELQADPILNHGYTAPEIYKGRKVDKRADIFSIGATLYTLLTGERLEAEGWLEEPGPIRFYPPHVVEPGIEQAVRRAVAFDPAARWANVDAFKAELVRLAGAYRIRAAVMTDVGMVREQNEDSVMALEYRRDSLVEPAQTLLYVVADGMGGAEAGEVASAIAVGVVRDYIEANAGSISDGDGYEVLRLALETANTKILEYQTAHPESRGMGSTAVAALLAPGGCALAWVGDSRAYLLENGQLRQITKDHSLVQRLIELGQITPEEARHHEHKNVITRSLGARPQGPAGVEAFNLRLKRGDRLLLCSDGLTAHVEDAEIAEILRRHRGPEAAARELIVAANAGGGTDNISVAAIYAD